MCYRNEWLYTEPRLYVIEMNLKLRRMWEELEKQKSKQDRDEDQSKP